MTSVVPDDDFDDDLDDDLDDDDDDDDDVTSAPAPTLATTATSAPVPASTTTAAPGAQTVGISQTTTPTTANPGTTLSTAISGNSGNNGNNGGGTGDDSAATTSATSVYTTTSGGEVFTVTTVQPASLTGSGATSQSGSSGLSTGAKAGIAIGVVIPLLLIGAAVAWFFWRRRKTKRLESKSGGWTGPTYIGAAEKRAPDTPGESDVTSKAVSGGFEGMAELHDRDRQYEAPVVPVYEMAAASPAELEAEPPLQHQRDVPASSPAHQSPSEGTYSSVSPLSPRSANISDAGASNPTEDNRGSLVSPDTASPASNIARKPLRPG